MRETETCENDFYHYNMRRLHEKNLNINELSLYIRIIIFIIYIFIYLKWIFKNIYDYICLKNITRIFLNVHIISVNAQENVIIKN